MIFVIWYNVDGGSSAKVSGRTGKSLWSANKIAVRQFFGSNCTRQRFFFLWGFEPYVKLNPISSLLENFQKLILSFIESFFTLWNARVVRRFILIIEWLQ